VLEKLKVVLAAAQGSGEGEEAAAADPSRRSEIGPLSSEFYSLIPTASIGRQAPPPLDSEELIGAKESQLEFWLRMGFEETKSLTENPITGIWDIEVPPTLKAACEPHGVSTKQYYTRAVTRGKALHKKKAGGPVRPMDAEKYGSIVLYTGQSIYRDLNKALREDHGSVAKYMVYLRLLLEAMGCMPQQQTTLWRGIAADLYEQYEEGKEVVWWSISSCTSDEEIAREFMEQLGGTATLITLQAKSALDIAPLSAYPKEKESLLAPGTKLRVLSRKREGKVTHIQLEEVGSAIEDRS